MPINSLYTLGSSAVGRLHSPAPRLSAIAVSEVSRLGARATVPVPQQRSSRNVQVHVTEVVRPGIPHSSEERAPEQFLDVNAILSNFNPLQGSHLLSWGDSDDEDGAVQAEVPVAGTWEDTASGYQGLEHQPSWIDYKDGSESDDPDALGSVRGAYNALAAVLPDLDAPEGISGGQSKASESANPGALPSVAIPSAYSAEAGFQEIPPHELEERIATGQFALLLDVRTRGEYDSGHIAGAVNLPMDPDLSEAVRSGSLDEFRDRPVAVVCASGMRSGQATVRLTKVYGFTNVTNATGGMMAWAREGLPMQIPPKRSGGCGCGSSQGGGGGCQGKQ